MIPARRNILVILLLLIGLVIGGVAWRYRAFEGWKSVTAVDSGSHAAEAPMSRLKRHEPTAGSNSSSAVTARVADALSDGTNYLSEVIQLSESLGSPDATPDQDIDTLMNVIEIYRKANGGNPTGLNHEIIAQLRGRNPKKYAVLSSDLARVNSDGELLDRWGTPYFFHAVSRDWLEIRSAGPDQIMWTTDDIATPELPVRDSAPSTAASRQL